MVEKFIYGCIDTLAGYRLDVNESCFNHFVNYLEVCKPEFEVCKHTMFENPDYEIHDYFLLLETGAKQLVASCCYYVSEEEI